MTDWQNKYEEEHARRCNLERRWDHRREEDQWTLQDALGLSGSETATREQLQQALADLVGIINRMDSP